MAIDVELRELEGQPYVGRRTTVPADAVAAFLHATLPAAWKAVEAAGATPSGPPFARWHRFSAEAVDIEGGVPVGERLNIDGDLLTGELPAGATAVARHVGPYEGLAEAHAELQAWCEANGRSPRGGHWEVYLSDPGEEPDPARWVTELYQPVE